ncbi:MAG TPA: hypothetical protein PLN31_05085 [Azoarcus taiwanensis]|nr:hypothetical protein [Azoarcus taiwanensis]
MPKIRLLAYAGFVVSAGLLAAAFALAQPSPQPQDCVCSPGISIGTDAQPRTIRHCQCGILSCVVVVESGQLQCAR